MELAHVMTPPIFMVITLLMESHLPYTYHPVLIDKILQIAIDNT